MKIFTKDFWHRYYVARCIRVARRSRDEERLMNNPNGANLYQLQANVLALEYNLVRYRDTYIAYYGKM